MRYLIAAILAAFFVSTAQASECSVGTMPVEQLVRFLNANRMTASFNLPQESAEKVAAYYNAQEPVTDWKPERVTVYYNRGAAILVLHIGECIASPGPAPTPVIERFLRKFGLGPQRES